MKKKNDKSKTLVPKKKKIITYSLLQKEVEEYGYHYSFKTFMWQLLLLVSFVLLVGYICKLAVGYMVVLGLVAVVLFPFIVVAQFRLLHNIDRFEQVELYVNNILPIFKQTPKILFTLKSVEPLVHGQMKKCVHDAIAYIENTSDVEVYANAFSIIEKEFPNSRVISIHQLMITVENGSSEDYYTVVDNMYYDVQQWISRSYMYQKEITQKKFELMFACLFSVVIDSLFSFLFNSNEMLAGYLVFAGYQIITAVFLIAMMFMICIFQMKLNGQWLVDDKTTKMDDRVMKNYKVVKSGNKKMPLQMLISCLLLLVVGIVFYIIDIKIVAIPFIVLALFLLFVGKSHYSMCKASVTKSITIEFPIWLREIALNLKNYTVVNAVKNSNENSSEIMKPFISDFMNNIENDPVSIEPYNSFFKGYDFPDGQSSLKILYSLRNLKKEEIDNQINSLVVRNQEMLAKSEKMKIDSQLSKISMLGYIPILAVVFLFSAHMFFTFIYMFSMVGQMMTM